MIGKEDGYKKEVIEQISKGKISIVNCAAKALAKVISTEAKPLALELLLADIAAGIFVENNEKTIGSGQIQTSMLAMQKVMKEKGVEAQGYEVAIETFIKAMEVGESAIVWVNGNHYITVTKRANDKYVIEDSNINGGQAIECSAEELQDILSNNKKVTKAINGNNIEISYQAKDKDEKIKILTTSVGLQKVAEEEQNSKSTETSPEKQNKKKK